MQFLFLLSLFYLTVPGIAINADGYNCQAPIKLAPPTDLSQTIYWPSMWNDSMPPIQMASQQDCVWHINVTDGLYASVVFYKNAPPALGIDVTFANGRSQGIDNDDLNPYIFTSPQFTLNLHKSNQNGKFSFKVNWSKYPDAPTSNIQLRMDAIPVTMVPNAAFNTFIADKKVSLVGFSLKNQSHYPLLRQSAVFDGDSTSAVFLGNLYQIMKSEKSVISSGRTLTIYTFSLDKQFDYTLYMAQDSSSDPGVVYYKGVNCFSGTDCSLTINALTGPSVLVTSGNNSEFLKNIGRLENGITLKIYEGPIGEDTLVTTITNANYQYRLPMELKNRVRQYLLSHNQLDITLSYDAANANWNQMYDGRKGFVHSYYDGFYSTQQDTNETFVSSTPLFFNYIVRDVDLIYDQTSLTVSIYRNNQLVSSAMYSSKNLPPSTTVSVQGDTYNVRYATNGVSTEGFRIDFSVTSTVYTPGTSTSRLSSTASITTSTTPSSTASSTVGSSTSTTSSTSLISLTSAPKSSTELLSSSSISTTNLPSSSTTVSRLETTTKGSNSPCSLVLLTLCFVLICSL